MTLSSTPATAVQEHAHPSAEQRVPATVTHLAVVPRTTEVGLRRRWRRVSNLESDAGLATAEYAIATLAAVGFAALLVAVLSSGEIRGMLMSLITNALSVG